MQLLDNPIFILGSPRSGTTLMRSIIDAHPHIFCPSWETGLFVHIDAILNGDLVKLMQLEGDRFPLQRSDVISWARRCTDELLAAFARSTMKPRWAEKTPAHVHHIRLIHEVFPRAQFIHMIRNGYDVVRSLQNMKWAPRRIGWSTRTWVQSVQAGRDASKVLPKDQYHEVRYENLIKSPEEVLKNLCMFLGEPFSAQMLEFHKPAKNSWHTSAVPLQSKPVNEYPDLALWQRMVFQWLAARLMRELDYSQ